MTGFAPSGVKSPGTTETALHANHDDTTSKPARADGDPEAADERCPVCDAPILAIVARGPSDQRYVPCGHRVQEGRR